MSAATLSLRAGALSTLRGTSRRAVLVVAATTIVLGALVGGLERHASLSGAADRALATCFRFLVPLSALALSALWLGRQNMGTDVGKLARFGFSKPIVAIGKALVAALSTSLVTVLTITAALVVTHAGNGRAAGVPLARDLLTSAWIGALVGALYALWFAFTATLGKQGGGRGIFLIFDFVVGDAGFFGVFMPRGIAYALIGRAAPMDLSQRVISASAFGVALLLLGLVALRSREA